MTTVIIATTSSCCTMLGSLVLAWFNRRKTAAEAEDKQAEANQKQALAWATLTEQLGRLLLLGDERERALNEARDELRQTREQRDTFQSRLDELEQKDATRSGQILALQAEIERLTSAGTLKDQRIDELEKQLAHEQAARKADRQTIDDLNQTIVTLNATIQQMETKLNRAETDRLRLEAEVAHLQGEHDDTVEIPDEVVTAARALSAAPPANLNPTLVLTAPDLAIQPPHEVKP